MQITKCFRDEDLRADRQPEFTQLDLEMSFADENDVMSVNEGFLQKIFREELGIELATPFRRMPFKEAMENYGSDKPDLRFAMEIQDLTEVVKDCGFKVFTSAVEAGGSVRAVVAKGAEFTRKEIDALTEHVKTYRAKGLAWMALGEEMRSSFAKFLPAETVEAIIATLDAEKGDMIFVVADGDQKTVCEALGQLRLELARRLNLIDENQYEVLWVTEFPLLEYDEEEQRCTAMHHPFTSPMDEDLPLLESDPLAVRAKAYDLVINGMEMGGGSIRIHDQQLQERMFKLLGFTQEQAWARFGFLLEAFKYGTPPHGGLAMGLDRLAMLIAHKESLRDVIAFPKVQNASCLMTGAPGRVEDKQLEELKIAIVEKE
jgi:aspartyl-tRNA synthetase